MAYGMHEDPALSPPSHLRSVEYPAQREQLARAAADGGAPVEVINLFKSLPREEYASPEEVMRDFAEAARRMAMGPIADGEDAVDRDRRNIGRDLVENAPEGNSHHP